MFLQLIVCCYRDSANQVDGWVVLGTNWFPLPMIFAYEAIPPAFYYNYVEDSFLFAKVDGQLVQIGSLCQQIL